MKEKIRFEEFNEDLQKYFVKGGLKSLLCVIFAIAILIKEHILLYSEIFFLIALAIALFYYLRYLKCSKDEVGAYTGKIIECSEINRVQKALDIKRQYILIKLQNGAMMKIYISDTRKYKKGYIVTAFSPTENIIEKNENYYECNLNYLIKVVGYEEQEES